MKNKMVTQVNNIKLEFSTENLTFQIIADNHEWKIQDGYDPYIEIETNDKIQKIFFKNAETVNHEAYKTGVGEGIRSIYKNLDSPNGRFDFESIIYIDYTFSELHCEFIMLNEPSKGTRDVVWPGPIDFSKKDSENYTVMSLMQGAIIPNNWDQNINIFDRWEMESGTFYTRSSYMPWWGQIEGRTGYMAIVETPFDGGFNFIHNCKGPTIMSPLWKSSLGRVDYNRKIRYIFLNDCDYNTMCKKFRNYLIETGELATLEEKIIKNPNIQKIIGTPIIHTTICKNIKPESLFYNSKNPEQNSSVISFEQREKELIKLKKLGIDNAFVHVDGWGIKGYDNMHPDIIPPSEEAGGFSGMKKLSQTAKNLGYIFATHDQYRDYYTDAKTYNEDQAICNENRELLTNSMWDGGNQTFLCAHFSPYYVKRNFEQLKNNGVELGGTYLDVFSCVALDECFNPRHRMTRKQCMEKRKECFDYVRSQGIIVSSEEGIGWAMRDLDLIHRAPYAFEAIPEEGTLCGRMLDRPFGIPVPLLNLVYHDCVVIPWFITDGKNEMPYKESGMLHALLNGGTSYLNIDADEEEIKNMRIVCDFHKKVACLEMVKHQFLSEDFKLQQVEFSDGTIIEVDFTTNKHLIKWTN